MSLRCIACDLAGAWTQNIPQSRLVFIKLTSLACWSSATRKNGIIGHFEFQKLSLSKQGWVQNLCYENQFYLHEKKIIFIILSFSTLGLTLKQRLEVTWKCPIYMQLKLTCIACRTFFMQAALVKSLSCVLRCACLLSSEAVAGVVHRMLLAHTLSKVAVSWAFWRRHSS